MDIDAFVARLAEVDRLHAGGAYEAAYAIIEDLLGHDPHSAYLLVRAAKLEQLLDRDDVDGAVSLESVRTHLEAAQRIEPSSITPVLELGHFAHAVENDPEEGLRRSEHARTLAESSLLEAWIGKIECLLELGERDLARGEIAAAHAYFGTDVDLPESTGGL